mmetsp:Transcript_3860/g.6107  ORF Transcript_3860/g.6107 Transcript_3860/m.6107 type:complete len:81 (+) Transcript_3860:177-419(+)
MGLGTREHPDLVQGYWNGLWPRTCVPKQGVSTDFKRGLPCLGTRRKMDGLHEFQIHYWSLLFCDATPSSSPPLGSTVTTV